MQTEDGEIMDARAGLHAPLAWGRIAGGYDQCLDAVSPAPDYLPRSLPAFMAEMLARVSSSYYGDEDAFARDTWDTLGAVRSERALPVSRGLMYDDALFRDHPGFRPIASARRVPTPVEAAIETIRRLRDTRGLEETLASHCAAILGGSVSYGRFINVKGGDDASDLDFLLVIEEWSQLNSLIEQLSRFEPMNLTQLKNTARRAAEFLHFVRDVPEHAAFSAKVELWSDGKDPYLADCPVSATYFLSIHVVTREGLGSLLLDGAAMIASSVLGDTAIMLDFRDSEPTRSDSQRSFSGKAVAIPLDTSQYESSFVRETRIFYIDDHDYYPGMFQNLVLPAFDVRWGGTKVRRLVESFRWKMIDRLRYETRNKPNKYLRLSLAHTRSEVFAPHMVRAVDASTQLA